MANFVGGVFDMTSRGALWHRWDPHIHTPETVLNDQFGGERGWHAYLDELEAKLPTIRAIAATDYYLTGTYEKLKNEKENNNRLPNVDLLFPNVELRLDVAAKKGFVNIHLLVCPDDENHLKELRRFLKRLDFRAFDDRFDCSEEGLIALGKRFDSSISDDAAALVAGVTQFKVNFDKLRDVYEEIAWARDNILIAVAGGSGDGSSGLQAAADETIRREIEKFAHIIFSSSPKQSAFWLGQSPTDNAEEIRSRFGALKPCLHGSDAHKLKDIGEAFADRFTWIKGALTFDALRQACIDPENRVFVGPKPPASAMPSQVVSTIEIADADWANTKTVELNPGLVTIIGARGSGKTALADIIAAGCDALPSTTWDADDTISSSFLARAKPLIGDAAVNLCWGGGDEDSRSLDGSKAAFSVTYPRARYLSQKFVEDLCSATKGPSEGLIEEVERVIFDAHDENAKEGTLNFTELRDAKIERFRSARIREADSLSLLSQRIGEEHEKEKLIPTLARQLADKDKLINGYRSDQSKLVVKGTEKEVERHNALTAARLKANASIDAYRQRRRSFETLLDEVKNMRSSGAPEMLRATKDRFQRAGLNDDQWSEFLMDYTGKVEDRIPGYVQWANSKIEAIKGSAVASPDDGGPVLENDADLLKATLAQIDHDITRLEGVIQADKRMRDQFAALTKRIEAEQRERDKIQERLKDAQGAAERRKSLHSERDDTYERIFEAIISEEKALAALYMPLQEKLNSASGTLGKLSLTIFRTARTKEWAEFAETKLLDRRTGKLKGTGTLTEVSVKDLEEVWKTGSAADAKAAMGSFIAEYYEAILDYAPVAREDETKFREWLGRFAQWLFSTDHLSVGYGIKYDGTDLENLSPGTRGIVLLLLYLALDDGDDRPLIIDQPEENLDPHSVNNELVPLFIAAKTRRQVIMVTHNANLVVNTDADQVIYATAGKQAPNGLPIITYQAGGLEDTKMRKLVCDTLEGGDIAFKERARRLRVRLRR